jgi:hypothetical protein
MISGITPMITPRNVSAERSLSVAGFSSAVALTSHGRRVPRSIYSIGDNLAILKTETPTTVC